jgi:lipopolysaccharide transport system ATP-binding protein
MPNTAIAIEGISKLYQLGRAEERHDSLAGAALAALASPVRNFRRLRDLDTSRATAAGADSPDLLWALRDVSFEVERGEVVGIIGRNGAGKSTLLKLLSRVSEPSRGRIRLRGRISSLLEVGTGFHPELSGRENVYLNGTILGMTKREVDRKFDEIVEFAGVAKFLDTPVKRYSSGMKVRLGFAVAAHLEPDVLIIDEVLAVGDMEFQKKCIGKMKEVAEGEGRTVLFVSHNFGTHRALCRRGIVLNEGRLAFDGSIEDAINHYLEQNSASGGDGTYDLRDAKRSKGGQRLRIAGVRFLDGETGVPLPRPFAGRHVRVEVSYDCLAESPLVGVEFSLGFRDRHGTFLTRMRSGQRNETFTAPPGPGRVVCDVPRWPLARGIYFFAVTAFAQQDLVDAVNPAGEVEVDAGDFHGLGGRAREHDIVYADFAWRQPAAVNGR